MKQYKAKGGMKAVTRDRENFVFRAFNLIAIFFVVDGHIPLEGELFGFGRLFAYYSFHLMMFAFSSGYFFRPERGVKEGTVHDVKHILLPLYFWNLIYGLICWLLRTFLGTGFGMPITPYTLLLAPITDGQHFVLNLGAWFLGALFLCKLFYRLLDALFKRMSAGDVIAFLISLLIGSAAVTMVRSGTALPVFLLRPMVLLPAYAAGRVYRTRIEKWDQLPTVPYLAALVILRLLLLAIYPNLSYLLSNLSYMPCNAFGVYAGGIIAIAFYLRIARGLAGAVRESRVMSFASRHTFDIMMHHGLGIFLTNCVFLVINYLHLGVADFSVSALRNEAGYVYSPGERPEFAALYVMTGIGFSLLCAFTAEKIKKYKKRP